MIPRLPIDKPIHIFPQPEPVEESENISEIQNLLNRLKSTYDTLQCAKPTLEENSLFTYNRRLGDNVDELFYKDIWIKINKIKNENMNIKYVKQWKLFTKKLTEQQFITCLQKIPGELFILQPEYFLISTIEKYFLLFSWNEEISRHHIDITIGSTEIEKHSNIKNSITKAFSKFIEPEKIFTNLSWYFNVKGDMHVSEFMEELDDIIHQEAYPYIENIEKFIDLYINSKESILLLLGPPGTGKTRLIRYILKKMAILKSNRTISGMFTSEKEVVENSRFYISLLSSDYHSYMIIEDMDYHLQRRTDGNFSMYNLLTASDGLIKNLGDKKIILSSNLPNVKNIDEALLRKGRCFSILKTRLLSPDESSILYNKLTNNEIKIEKPMSLSEVYALIEEPCLL